MFIHFAHFTFLFIKVTLVILKVCEQRNCVGRPSAVRWSQKHCAVSVACRPERCDWTGDEATAADSHDLRPALGSFVHTAGRLSDVSVFVCRQQNTVTATVAAVNYLLFVIFID